VTAVIEPVIAEAGLFLEEVRLVGAGASQVLRVTIDLPETEIGALDSDRLGDVSRAVSAALDADDVVPGAYNLEVSTPGAARPLTERRHYARARGRLVKLELKDGSPVLGRVIAVSADDDPIITLLADDGARSELLLSDVRKGKVEVELNRLSDAELDALFGDIDDIDDIDADDTDNDDDDAGAELLDDDNEEENEVDEVN